MKIIDWKTFIPLNIVCNSIYSHKEDEVHPKHGLDQILLLQKEGRWPDETRMLNLRATPPSKLTIHRQNDKSLH
jgi:hypothetical protein